MPSALLFAVPCTILFAACSVYGRMSASNEVVAVKSLGVNPMTIVWPALVLAFLFSLVTTWLNDVAVSWGACGVDRVVIRSVEDVAYGMLRTHRSYRTNRFSINVKRVDGRKHHELITDGPCSICRNPLYLGTFLMLLAVGVVSQSFSFIAFSIVVSSFYLWITVPVEECSLNELHGPAF